MFLPYNFQEQAQYGINITQIPLILVQTAKGNETYMG